MEGWALLERWKAWRQVGQVDSQGNATRTTVGGASAGAESVDLVAVTATDEEATLDGRTHYVACGSSTTLGFAGRAPYTLAVSCRPQPGLTTAGGRLGETGAQGKYITVAIRVTVLVTGTLLVHHGCTYAG
jgi:hypothetical protein